MTIGCVRCGASQEGDIISGPVSFTFKHDPGCGMGIGPLCVLKGKITKKVEEKKKKQKETIREIPTEIPTHEDIRVESTESISSDSSNYN